MATARPRTGSSELLRMKPGNNPVVTCYLKIEPRDRARNKYLTKLKNRVKSVENTLTSSDWTRAQQDMIRADLARIVSYLSKEKNLPDSQGIALFAASGKDLFEVHPLPRVHRSRLVVDRTPLVRELAAAQEEFGRIIVVTVDRNSALVWQVDWEGAAVARKVETDTTQNVRPRGGRSDGSRGARSGEHTFNNRIRDERRRHFETVARALFEVDRGSPAHQIILAGAGKDANALEPFIHRYLADRLIGLAKLAPKDATPAAVHSLAREVHEAHREAMESNTVEQLHEGLGSGWAVNGLTDTLASLNNGQVGHLLVRGEAEMPGFRSLTTGRLTVAEKDLRDDGEVVASLDIIDDAIEEALRQRVSVDVIYQPEAAEAIAGLAGLLRFT